MVEGAGSKEYATIRTAAHRDPAFIAALMDILVEATITYLDEQAAAGAEVLMLFDSWSGVLSPSLFRTLVIAPTARIVAALRTRRPGLPLIGFPRLAGVLVGEYATATGVDAVALDTGADLQLATALLPPNVASQGNLDPLAVVAGGPALQREVETVLAGAHGRPHIFNLGHGIVPHTPPEHVQLLVDQVRAA